MYNNTTGLSLLISLVATSIFGYCSFIGLNYGLKGKWLLSAAIVVFAFALMFFLVLSLINSKKNRNRREGRPTEIRSGIMLVAILLFGSVPFTKFLEIYGMRNELNVSVRETVAVVSQIDSAYNEYAQERLHAMKSKKMRRSLERRLMPQGIEETAQKRQAWLQTIKSPSIWNLYTATNIHHLLHSAETWSKEYTQMSSVMYEGEDCEPFSHEVSQKNIDQFNKVFTDFHRPSGLSVFYSLLCGLCIAICYFLTRRPKNNA